MGFILHPGETRRIGAPKDWDPAAHGPCGTVSVSDLTSATGLPFMETLWRPDAADRAAMAAGAALVLGVAGPCHFARLTIVSKRQHLTLIGGEPKAPSDKAGQIAFGMTADGLIYPFFTTPVEGEGGIRFHEGVWRKQDGEVAAIDEGDLIAVAIGGAQHPVVYLGVRAPQP